MNASLNEHLRTGLTNVCRCWKIDRSDGVSLGFTDHDCDLTYDGVVYKAGSGLTASALAQGTGLSVDNTEAVGALDSVTLREEDIEAGIFDDAEVVIWLVNWSNVVEREIQFRGYIGEITREGGQFRAELRSLSDKLNQPKGRVFQKPCSAVLGDGRCGLDVSGAAFQSLAEVVGLVSSSQVIVQTAGEYDERWFERGKLELPSGRSLLVKKDEKLSGSREITLWEGKVADLTVGEQVSLIAGCDRRFETCRVKFENASNFQGFPDIPGDDWLTQMPANGQLHDGGGRR